MDNYDPQSFHCWVKLSKRLVDSGLHFAFLQKAARRKIQARTQPQTYLWPWGPAWNHIKGSSPGDGCSVVCHPSSLQVSLVSGPIHFPHGCKWLEFSQNLLGSLFLKQKTLHFLVGGGAVSFLSFEKNVFHVSFLWAFFLNWKKLFKI